MNASRKRPSLLIGLAIFVIAGSLIWIASLLERAFPPRSVTMATGPEGGAYRELGERYRQALAREGIRLNLVGTAGDLENLKLLKEPRGSVSAAFVTGGTTSEEASPGLVSLGVIANQPLWVFCSGPEPTSTDFMRGKRLSIGPEGAGTRFVMTPLIEINHLAGAVQTLPLTPVESRDALKSGEIDCASLLTTAESPIVQDLLSDARFNLMSFARADAYVAHFPFLRKVILPTGVADLATNRPPHDTTLLAAASSLLVREDLHPAIQYLLLEAAQRIHSGAGMIRKPGEFPAAEPVDLPLSREARSFYKSGGSFMQRHLPFWLWVFATRALLVIVPIAGILLPLAHTIPLLITQWWDWRLNRFYRELLEIEARAESPGPRDEGIARDLEHLEKRIRRARIPPSQARLLYTLQNHVHFVHERLARAASPP